MTDLSVAKIWIARHPAQLDNVEVSFTEPNGDGVCIYSNLDSEPSEYVEWVECVLFPVRGFV